MYIAVTIDTEEDNWGDYSRDSYGIENIKKLPSLQKIFNEYNVIPTYLVSYPVATNQQSVHILKEILQSGNCEIGMHCHPWSTPPFEEERNSFNSMLCNLPDALQQKKMHVLHEAIEKNIGVRAKSFRAGRWGYSGAVSKVLLDLGYNVDTSITPFTDWSEYHGPDYSRMTSEPYRFNTKEIYQRVDKGELMEIPATIGYIQSNYELCSAVDRILTSRFGRRFRLKGILNRLNLLNKVWLSPEASDYKQMIELTKVFIRKEYIIINLFFHSTSLEAGLSFVVKTRDDEIRFLNRLSEYFAFTSEAGIKPIKLSESWEII